MEIQLHELRRSRILGISIAPLVIGIHSHHLATSYFSVTIRTFPVNDDLFRKNLGFYKENKANRSSVVQRSSIKMVLLKISQYSQEFLIPVLESLLDKVAGPHTIASFMVKSRFCLNFRFIYFANIKLSEMRY